MKGSITLFLFLSSIFNTYCQTTKIDSLIISLATSKNDTIKVETIQSIIGYYSVNDLPKANLYSDSLYSLARDMKFPRAEINSHVLKGILEYRKSDYKSAIAVWNKGLNHPKIDDYFFSKVSLTSNIATGYKVISENDSFIKYSERALKLNRDNDNSIGLLAGYFNMAEYYSSNRDINLAAEYTISLMDLALEENNLESIGRAHILFGKQNRMEFQYQVALDEFNKALDIYSMHFPNNIVLSNSIKYEISRTLMDQGNFKDAIHILENLLKDKYNGIMSESLASEISILLLKCHIHLKKNSNAKPFYRELKEGTYLSNIRDSISYYSILSQYEIENNSIDNTTIEKLQLALSLARKTNNTESQFNLHKLLSLYYSKIGKYNIAFEQLEKSVLYRDSIRTSKNAIINLSHQRRFGNIVKENKILEQKSEISIKEKEIQNQKIKQQKLWIVLFIAGIIMFIMFVIFLLSRSKILKQKIATQQAVSEKKALEVKVSLMASQLQKKNAEFDQQRFKEKPITLLPNPLDFDFFLREQFELDEEELNLWKYIADGYNQKEQANKLCKSIDAIKTWKRVRLYPKLHKKVPLKAGYTQHTATKLFTDQIKRFYLNENETTKEAI